jgi:aryl-alcohol dehydrogenase-like predicted oxidoreductase
MRDTMVWLSSSFTKHMVDPGSRFRDGYSYVSIRTNGYHSLGSIERGKFQSKQQIAERKKSGEALRAFRPSGSEQTKDQTKVSAALEKVADELGGGYSVTTVALAYVLLRAPYVFPIIGGWKVSHLQVNI